MKSTHLCIFFILFLAVGCVANQKKQDLPQGWPSEWRTSPSVRWSEERVPWLDYRDDREKLLREHQYELTIVDVDGNPLEGVRIDYELKDRDIVVKSNSYVTTTDGKLLESLSAAPDPKSQLVAFYESSFVYNVSKEGYYKKSGTMSCEVDNTEIPREKEIYDFNNTRKREEITLLRPIDYLNKEFASKLSNVKLKTRILSFIDFIILEGLLTQSVLNTQSVTLVDFKKKTYLQLRFVNANVYNSLRFNKYDIGKMLFDEVIRKILGPLNQYIAEPALFYGYDLIVVGYTKNLVDKYATPNPIEYRFMIPEIIVEKYKNKDITGQQVLDGAIILMDDERIELKLQ